MKLPSIRIAAIIIASLPLASCTTMEWRGGMMPSLKWRTPEDVKRLENSSYDGNLVFRLDGNSSNLDWPDFRGPKRQGIAPPQGVSIDWQQKPALIWRRSVGLGHSSIITMAARLYTMEQQGEFETLSCRSMKTGAMLWRHQVQIKWKDSMGGIGPRSTPVAADGRIYALFSNGSLVCLQAMNGNALWKRNVLDSEYQFPHWGLAPSPLVINDLVIVSPGGEQGAVKAYDARTGKPGWVSGLKGKGVYLSPMSINLQGELHLVAAVEGMLAGLNPLTGQIRWKYPWKIFMTNAQIAQPLAISENVLLLSAGYGKGAEAIRLKKTASGVAVEQVWKSKNLKTKFSSPVLKDGYLYGFNESSLTCLNGRTGALMWRGAKYGYGRILLVDKQLLILGNMGKLSIVKAQPDAFSEISSAQLLSEERAWNGPAMVGGYLILRNGSEIACYDYATH